MSIQCPACLQENLSGTTNCLVCGYILSDSFPSQEAYHLPVNTLLKQGSYQVTKILGSGGFGITYRGIFVSKQIKVAIKELWPEKGARIGTKISWPYSIPPQEVKQQINKFKLEAKNQGQCVSPHIPKIYECFEENNTAYIIMEMVEGRSLAKIFKEEGKINETRLKKYFIQVAEALKVIHNNNFLHRDIKPDNIIINPQDQAVLIDFGATREFLDGKSSTMSTILTPGYAPYEQYSYRSKRFPATDFYALCASMYELLTGELPIEAAERVNNILQKKADDPLISPRQLTPKISPLMDTIILTGMRIKVEERFQTAQELIDALQGKYISPSWKKAQELVKQQKLTEAVNAYKKCLQGEPHNGEAAAELALVQIQLNEREAETAAEQALKLGSQDGRVYGVLGLVDCRRGNWQQALQKLEKAANLAPQEVWIQANLAWALGKTYNLQEAEIATNRALKLDSNCTFALGLKTWIAVEKKEWKEAVKSGTQAVFKAKQTSSRDSEKLRAWVYPYLIVALEKAVTANNSADVNRKIADFIQQSPDSAVAWGLKGWHEARQGLFDESLMSFREALKKPDVPPWIMLNLGVVEENLQRFQDGVNTYQNYEQQFPANVFVLFRIGTLLGKMGKWKEAKSYLEKAVSLDGNLAEAKHNLAWVLLNLKNSAGELENATEILTLYRQAISLYQQHNSIYAQKIKDNFKSLGIQI